MSRPLAPPWDLDVVLEELKSLPFKQLQGVELKFLTQKTVLLLSLAFASAVFMH